MRAKVIVCGFILFFVLASVTAVAGVGIDPSTVEIMAEPGKELQGTFKVSNTGSAQMSLDVEFEDWFKKGVAPASWLRVEPKKIMIKSGETVELKYVVNIPAVPKLNEYMAMVFFNGLEQGSNVTAGFGVPFYVAVKGQAKIEAEIKEFSLTYKEGEGFSGYLLVENKGNVHLRPVITVAVPSDKQEHLKYFTLPLGVPIQAAKERKFEIKNERFYLEPGTYKINITCNYGDIYNVDKKVGKTTDFVIPATGEAVTVEYKGGSGK